MCSKDEDGNGNSSSVLSRVSILVGFICASSYFVAFVGNGWVYTKESYRLTNLNLYASVTFKIGLWKTCHSFQRINSTIILPPPGCTVISYSNWNEVTLHGFIINSDVEPTLNVLTRIRWCTVFVGFGFILLLIGFIYSVIGHFYQDNKTLLASAIYTLSGLSMAAGLFIFVCVLTDSFAGLSYTSEAHSWSIYDLRRSRDYKYGWCFLTAAVGCIFVEMVAVLCITVHYRRCQTIALMIKNIVPLIEDKTSNTYFATNDKGLLMKADEEKAKVDLKSSPCEETHGVTSETPPDICSTFLNAEQSDIDLESDERTVSTASARDVHLDMAPHSQNKLAKRANFATLNTRNYRCLNYPTVRKYSTLGGCNLLTMERGTNPPASSSNFNQVHCHQKTCAQSTMPRMKTACVNTNKYHTTDRHAKMAELQQLSCDDFNL